MSTASLIGLSFEVLYIDKVSIIDIAQSISGIVSPFLFIGSESPRYPTAFASTMAFMAVTIGLAMLYVLLCHLDNKSRDKLPPSERDQAFDDLTDKENKGMIDSSQFQRSIIDILFITAFRYFL